MIERWENIDADTLEVNFKNDASVGGIPVTNEFIETLLTFWEFVAQQKEEEFKNL